MISHLASSRKTRRRGVLNPGQKLASFAAGLISDLEFRIYSSADLRHCILFIVLLGLSRLQSAAASLQIDQSQSTIEVAISSTTSSFLGRLEKYLATIECEPSQALPTKADVVFDFKDLKTGVQGRDAHMLEWLKYTENPTGAFHLTGWSTEGGETLALGQLTLHGVKCDIRVPVVIKHQLQQYDIQGSVALDHRDFGLKRIRMALLFTVNPHLKVNFHLVGKVGN
jgi:polyisoprenoid-binding protein YceI